MSETPSVSTARPDFSKSGIIRVFQRGITRALRGIEATPDLVLLVRHVEGEIDDFEFWSSGAVSTDEKTLIIKSVAGQLAAGDDLGELSLGAATDLQAFVAPVQDEAGILLGALVVVRKGPDAFSEVESAVLRIFGSMCATSWEEEQDEAYRDSLDDLVVEVANRLMSASGLEVQESLDWTVERLAGFLGADVAFLRFNDHDAGTSNMAAEFPHREDIPDPDPLGVVSFDSDPMFEMTRDFKEPIVGAQSTTSESYREIVTEARTDLPWSGAAVPLLDGDVTTGVLAFIYLDERSWTQSEINALMAVASLLAQTQGRILAEAQLLFNADHDEMTGLNNRRSLLREIDRRLARDGAGMALLFMDLDRFKIMNDFLGHNVGDQILVVCAERVRHSLRPGDFAARLGGDEFVVLLEHDTDEPGAVAAASRLLELCSAPIEVEGKHVSHTGSVGIMISDETSRTSGQMLSCADVALYEAKRQGGNQAVVFDAELSRASDERSNLELMLRQAIVDDDLLLHYQPEFDLVTGEILAVETLVRWQHAERGLMAAGEFIELAEETGLIVDLGQWIFDEACQAMATMLRSHVGGDLTVRINVSPAELSVEGSVDFMLGCIERARIRPEQVCVEITEHAFIGDLGPAVEKLKALRAAGINLAIDDFGTGFSSLTQLKELPFTVMKIDGSFVNGMSSDPINRVLAQTCVNLASAFDLAVVAEGVEEVAEINQLLEIGCHRAQGYLLARPMAIEPLLELLSKGSLDIEALGR